MTINIPADVVPNPITPTGPEVTQRDIGALSLGGVGFEDPAVGQTESTRPNRQARPSRIVVEDGVSVYELSGKRVGQEELDRLAANEANLSANLKAVGLGQKTVL